MFAAIALRNCVIHDGCKVDADRIQRFCWNIEDFKEEDVRIPEGVRIWVITLGQRLMDIWVGPIGTHPLLLYLVYCGFFFW